MSHYYENKSGDIIPRHFVPVQSRPGESRPTRISDARKHGYYPSVTTVLGMLDKPALVNWKVEQHLKQAYNLAGSAGEGNFTEWMGEVKRKTEIELSKAPDAGSDVHKSLEMWFDGRLDFPLEHMDICEAVDESLCDSCGEQEWTSEKSFTHPLGFAGRTDLSSPGWVIDFKTKQTADKFKPGKMAYPEHARQLAAYRIGLGLTNARCANVFICIEDGQVDFHEHGPETLTRAWETFSDLLRIWIREAEYTPGTPS